MKSILKKSFLFAAALFPIALIAGAFAGVYSYSIVSEDMQQMYLSQVGSFGLLILATAIQTGIYAFIFGFLGYILAEKIGLMKPILFEKEPLGKVLPITLICGILLSLDYWTFGKALPELSQSYQTSFSTLIASVLYGGIIEEILMRLFLMSLFVWLSWKVFFRKKPKEELPGAVWITANILVAALFAAGHLPSTLSIFEQLTPMILFRCFLLNGGFGIVFGHFYRKYGIQYAMLSHMGCHIVSKLIWMIFI